MPYTAPLGEVTSRALFVAHPSSPKAARTPNCCSTWPRDEGRGGSGAARPLSCSFSFNFAAPSLLPRGLQPPKAEAQGIAMPSCLSSDHREATSS
jgi:hypothetical protein